ncbi:MAG: D-alanyl-D-alanine carboxypeptidase [Clostridia bacterium]|nr:D-alanyl-D-alanine carboxypeptidase [Clostridia bacterium]
MKIRVAAFAALISAAVMFAPVLSSYPISPASQSYAGREPDPFCFDDADLVSVSAQAAVLMEAESGRVLFSKNPHLRLPMASTTKIMTCLLACELSDRDELITVTAETTGIEGSSVYLTAGETLTVKELLYCAMLRSGNDAARTLAKACGGSVSNFVSLMNLRARSLGMYDTCFANPDGLPEAGHYTTAYDLALLTAAALKNDLFAEVCSAVRVTVCGGKRTLINRNKLLPLYSGMTGVKTGYTPEAGHCLVTSAARGNVKLVAVTLNDGDMWFDHRIMLDCGFKTLRDTLLFRPGELRAEADVAGTDGNTVFFSNPETVRASLPQGAEITYRIEKPQFVYAPVKRGDTRCRALIYAGGDLIAIVPLCAESDAEYEKHNLFERLTGR